MINLGPFSGRNCPNVHFRPALLDRFLEGAAILIFLTTCGCIFWLYTRIGEGLLPNVWIMGGASLFTLIVMGACSYVPVRLNNFPVRVNERNIGIQYLLAVRLTRVMNVILNLMFLSGAFLEYYKSAFVFFSASFVLLALAFVGYYILAFKYK